MQESIWKVLMFIITLALLIGYPTVQMWEMQESMLQIEITNLVSEFLDEVRYTQSISLKRYHILLNTLKIIDHSIDIELKHKASYWIPDLDNEGNETGRAHQVHIDIGHDEIMERMEASTSNVNHEDALLLSEGDWIEITVMNHKKTKAQVIRELLWRVPLNYSRYYVRLSGMIH